MSTKRTLKVSVICILLVLVSSLVLACTSSQKPPSSTLSSTAKTTSTATVPPSSSSVKSTATTSAASYPLSDWPKSVTIEYVGTGGTSQAYAIMMSTLIDKYLKVKATPVQVRGGTEKWELYYKGEINLPFSGNRPNETIEALKGTGEFASRGPLKFQLWGNEGMFMVMNVMTRADSGIKTGNDLRGKRVMFIRAGSAATELLSRVYMEAYGINPDKDVTPRQYTDVGEAFDALRQKTADVVMMIRGYPDSTLIDLAKTVGIRWLPADNDKLGPMKARYPWIAIGSDGNTIPAGTYAGVDKDIPVIGDMGVKILPAGFPNSFVYQLMDLVYGSHRDEFVQSHAAAQRMLATSIPVTIGLAPFHPGAIKFLKDKGIWTAEHDRLNDLAIKAFSK